MSSTAARKPRKPPPNRDRQTIDGRVEIKYYGINACRAIWQNRPGDIFRAYIDAAVVPRCGDLLADLAERRVAYHVVDGADLDRITESVHHEGICLCARDRLALSFTQLLHRLRHHRPALLVYLDGVGNPHNMGAIARSCAHFGTEYMLIEKAGTERLPPSACRIAEGGAEVVDLVPLADPVANLVALRNLGFKIVTAQADGEISLPDFRFPHRSILVLGGEESGVSPAIKRLADFTVAIPGSGMVESLNVSVACAVLSYEFRRQSSFLAGPRRTAGRRGSRGAKSAVRRSSK